MDEWTLNYCYHTDWLIDQVFLSYSIVSHSAYLCIGHRLVGRSLGWSIARSVVRSIGRVVVGWSVIRSVVRSSVRHSVNPL